MIILRESCPLFIIFLKVKPFYWKKFVYVVQDIFTKNLYLQHKLTDNDIVKKHKSQVDYEEGIQKQFLHNLSNKKQLL